MTTQEILEAARSAKSALALADNTARNAALLGMADALCDAQNQSAILAANAEDMAAAKGHISDVMLDRLALGGFGISFCHFGLHPYISILYRIRSCSANSFNVRKSYPKNPSDSFFFISALPRSRRFHPRHNGPDGSF